MNEMIIDNRYFDTIYKNFRKRNLSFKEKSFDNENIFISKEIDIKKKKLSK